MWNVLYSLFAILSCLFLGYGVYYIIGGIPASLYGMLILTTFLSFNIIKVERIKQTVQWIIANMGICFVPTSIGIVEYVSLIKSYGLIITVAVIVTTLLLMTIVGFLYQYFIENENTITNNKE